LWKLERLVCHHTAESPVTFLVTQGRSKRSRVQKTEYRAGFRTQNTEHRIKKPEARSQKPEARSQKPEARSQKPEARSQRHKKGPGPPKREPGSFLTEGKHCLLTSDI
jgi:hypothetical protein